MPYFDSTWVGELANYGRGPDHYLVTIAGVKVLGGGLRVWTEA